MPNRLGAQAPPVARPLLPMLVAESRLPCDAAFKRFVHYAPSARHLLRAYPLPGLDEASVVRIEQARANLVGPDLSQHRADGVWLLTLWDGELVYLLLECQSEPDPAMSLRMLHAVANPIPGPEPQPARGARLHCGAGAAHQAPDGVQRAPAVDGGGLR